jgi:hypothetical protein
MVENAAEDKITSLHPGVVPNKACAAASAACAAPALVVSVLIC